MKELPSAISLSHLPILPNVELIWELSNMRYVLHRGDWNVTAEAVCQAI